MSNIADQVADLTYLVDSPLATPYPLVEERSSMSGRRGSAEIPAEGGKKRKVDDRDGESGTMDRNGSVSGGGSGNVADGGNNGVGGSDKANGAHTRAKRNRYISIACNECKRRKIKCNGNTPCQRCGNLNLECQYAPNCCTNGFKESEEFRQMNDQLASLQEQVNNLYANLSALRSQGGDGLSFAPQSERSMSISQPPSVPQPISPVSRYRPASRHTSYRGPTSFVFGLDVAKNTLHNMGYQGLGADDGTMTQDPTPMASPRIRPAVPLVSPIGQPLRDPIWVLSREEMIRLCRVYEEEMGIMYPVVDIEKVIIHGNNVYTFVESARQNSFFNANSDGKGLTDLGSSVLKMVLACALLTEGNGRSETAYSLFESVRDAADRILHGEVFEVKDLSFLVLVAVYHFHCDEEALAWRIIGQTARMGIELGLHRRDSLYKAVSDDVERSHAINLFWSIYVLDRRWSFGTGMPFALQDADIDPTLPEPELSIPYLNVMIAYSRIGSKVWRSVSSFTPSPALNIEEIGYLDYQVQHWQKSIPASLQLSASPAAQTPSRAIHRLQILLYLRANQMRILIYRPVLHSASSIQENLQYASTVVELAKDTIHALTHLNQTSDIYRCQQVCFNYFLTSAIAVIFLASCHAPVHFSSICRDEFYMALDLVKGFSTKSWVTRRLWKTIKGLKKVGPKLGLVTESERNQNLQDDPHSSAALAMAGLAGHEIQGIGGGYELGIENAGGSGQGNGRGGSPNGFQISHDMTSLFEAALGSAGLGGAVDGRNGGSGYGMGDGGGVLGVNGGVNGNVVGAGSNVFGGEEELYRHLRDLF